jgi:hypothetical protein
VKLDISLQDFRDYILTIHDFNEKHEGTDKAIPKTLVQGFFFFSFVVSKVW